MKRIGLLILCIMILITGLSGCFLFEKPMEERMLEYVEERYGEDKRKKEFELVSYVGGGWKVIPRAIIKTIDGKLTFDISSWKNDEGVFRYFDSYVAVKYEEETKEWLRERIDEVYGAYGEYWLGYWAIGMQTNVLDKESTFAEYFAECANQISFKLVLPVNAPLETKEEDFEQLCKQFRENKAFLSGTIIYVEEEGQLEEARTGQYVSKVYSDKAAYRAMVKFVLDEELTRGYARWYKYSGTEQ